MAHPFADGQASVSVPQPGGVVIASRENVRAVKAERRIVHGSVMPQRLAARPAGPGVPELGGVGAGCEELSSVGTKHHGRLFILMVHRLRDLLAGFGVP